MCSGTMEAASEFALRPQEGPLPECPLTLMALVPFSSLLVEPMLRKSLYTLASSP